LAGSRAEKKGRSKIVWEITERVGTGKTRGDVLNPEKQPHAQEREYKKKKGRERDMSRSGWETASLNGNGGG